MSVRSRGPHRRSRVVLHKTTVSVRSRGPHRRSRVVLHKTTVTFTTTHAQSIDLTPREKTTSAKSLHRQLEKFLRVLNTSIRRAGVTAECDEFEKETP